MNAIFSFGIIILVLIVFPIWLIYKINKRVAKKGTLFTGQSTLGMKVLAIVLGILFAGLFIMELLSSQSITLMFPVLAFALLGYGLGAGQLLNKLQNKGENSHSSVEPTINQEFAIESLDEQDETKIFSQNRLLRFIIRWGIILAGSALFLYGAFWVAAHPNNPFALVFVIGVIVLVLLLRVLGWFKFLRNLFK